MKPEIGDCIFFSGTGFVSHAIRAVTGGKFSHVAIVSGVNPVVVTEALAKGLVYHSLYDDLRDYDGQVWLAKLSDTSRDAFKLERFHNWITGYIGTPYGYFAAGEAGLHSILHKYHPKVRKHLFCSEAAVLALQAGGVIPPNIDAAETTPNDLWDFRTFGWKGRIN